LIVAGAIIKVDVLLNNSKFKQDTDFDLVKNAIPNIQIEIDTAQSSL
jgi:hypothetical protein